MDCNLCRSKIVSFLKKETDDSDRRKLLLHFDSCESCRNELKLHYFVNEGLKRLEDGGNLNLEAEFQNMIFDESERADSVHAGNVIINSVAIASTLFVIAILIRSFFVL